MRFTIHRRLTQKIRRVCLNANLYVPKYQAKDLFESPDTFPPVIRIGLAWQSKATAPIAWVLSFDDGEIWRYTVPQFRNKGIGTQLLQNMNLVLR